MKTILNIHLLRAPAERRNQPLVNQHRHTGVRTRVIPGVLLLLLLLAADSLTRAHAEPALPRKLEVGEVFKNADAGYQFTVNIGGWTQVKKGTNGTDAELEFTSNLDANWAVLFVMERHDLDEKSDQRVNWIRSRHPGAACRDKRKLADNGAYLIGSLLCKGTNLLEGRFRYLSRVVSDGEKSIELFMFVSNLDNPFLPGSRKYWKLANGLELL